MIRPEYLNTVFKSDLPTSGWPQAFAVVTAWNPNGEVADAVTNAQRDSALRFYCEARGIMTWRVSGGSPDWQHSEIGLGVVTALEHALVLGRRFDQEAIFWVENDQLNVICCATGERQHLDCWSDRVVCGSSDKSA